MLTPQGDDEALVKFLMKPKNVANFDVEEDGGGKEEDDEEEDEEDEEDELDPRGWGRNLNGRFGGGRILMV
jgi:hypothetical protein